MPVDASMNYSGGWFNLLNHDVFLKKGGEKIRKRRGSVIHWEPTEARPKGKAEGGQEPAKWHVI